MGVEQCWQVSVAGKYSEKTEEIKTKIKLTKRNVFYVFVYIYIKINTQQILLESLYLVQTGDLLILTFK